MIIVCSVFLKLKPGFFLTSGDPDDSRGLDGASLPSAASAWSSLGSRFMQLPYTPLTDRSMYSAAVYGKLFGFGAPGLPLPPLALNTLASGIATSGSGFSTGNSVYVNDDSTIGAEAQQNGAGGGYQCGVYGPRYHPYLAYSASSKRLDSAILH